MTLRFKRGAPAPRAQSFYRHLLGACALTLSLLCTAQAQAQGTITVNAPADGTVFASGAVTTFDVTATLPGDFILTGGSWGITLGENVSNANLAIHPAAMTNAGLNVNGLVVRVTDNNNLEIDDGNGFDRVGTNLGIARGATTVVIGSSFFTAAELDANSNIRVPTAADFTALFGMVQLSVDSAYTGDIPVGFGVGESDFSSINGGTQENVISEVTYTAAAPVTINSPAADADFLPGDVVTLDVGVLTPGGFLLTDGEMEVSLTGVAEGVTLGYHPDAINASLTVGDRSVDFTTTGGAIDVLDASVNIDDGGGSDTIARADLAGDRKTLTLQLSNSDSTPFRFATAADLTAILGAVQLRVDSGLSSDDGYTGEAFALEISVTESAESSLNGGTQESLSAMTSHTVFEPPLTDNADAVFMFTGNDNSPLLPYVAGNSLVFRVTSTPPAGSYLWSARALPTPDIAEMSLMTPTAVDAGADATLNTSGLATDTLIELTVTTILSTQTTRERITGRFLVSVVAATDGIDANIQNLGAVRVSEPGVVSEPSVVPGIYALAERKTDSARVTTPSDVIAVRPTPPGYIADAGLYSFTVRLSEASSRADVVITLASTLTATAVPYKYDMDVQVWNTFDLNDGGDAYYGAEVMENGQCPATDNAAWTRGLLAAGDVCLRVTLTDGGPNDADGTRNGVVHDPIALAVLGGGGAGGGGGGVIDPLWLLLMWVGLLLGLKRHRSSGV